MFVSWDISNIFTAIGLIGGSIAFGFGFFQYVKAQKWKRAEWVATEISDFFSDDKVRAALTMIDWGERPVLLFPDDADPEKRYFRTTDLIVKRSLEYHTNHGPYLPEEAGIRDAFDRLLDRLERFNHFIETGLIEKGDIEPYFRYWLKEIGSITPDTAGVGIERIKQLHHYMRDYHFDGACELFRRFGFHIYEDRNANKSVAAHTSTHIERRGAAERGSHELV